MYYYIPTDSTHEEGNIVVSRWINEIKSVELFSQSTNGTNSQRQHLSEMDLKMQLLGVHIPENVLSSSPKFS